MPGLPEPPGPGSTALPPGTFADVPVFVTGAGTGLGKAIAVEFARLGAAVVIASRAQEHLDAGAAAVADAGARVLTVTCDIRQPDEIERLGVEIGVITLDVPRLLQCPHTAQAWWRRNLGAARQFHIRDAPVRLELRKDAQVDGVQLSGIQDLVLLVGQRS